MKIEIPHHGVYTIEEMRKDIASSREHDIPYTADIVEALINKIEELQSYISALECELDNYVYND